MKDLLSKEHKNFPYMAYHPFLQKILGPCFYDFSKILTPLKIRGVHTLWIVMQFKFSLQRFDRGRIKEKVESIIPAF